MLKAFDLTTGAEIMVGDTVNYRGGSGTLAHIERANDSGHDGKVRVTDSHAAYARVFNLRVEDVD